MKKKLWIKILSWWHGVKFEKGYSYQKIKHTNLDLLEKHHHLLVNDGWERFTDIKANFSHAWGWYRKIISVLLIVTFFASCSKQPENTINEDRCYFACLLSDKYAVENGDTLFVVRDTLWIQPCLNKYWFEKEKEAAINADGLFRHCTPFIRNGQVVKMEIWTHVFDRGKITHPKIF